MGKQQLVGAVSAQWHRHAQIFGQVVVGKLNFVAKQASGDVISVGDDAGPCVLLAEQAGIQKHDTYQRGEPELTGLEDDVAIP